VAEFNRDDFEEQMANDEPLASKQAYEEFLGSLVWQDMKNVFMERIEAYRDLLEFIDKEGVVKVQSGIEELRFALILPEETIKRLGESEDGERED